LKLGDVTDNRITDVPSNLTWQPRSRRPHRRARRPHVRRQVASLRSDVDIVIRDNRIEQVVEHRADLHTGRIVDAGSDVVMPGLIEMHVHLSPDFGERLGRIWLAYGITLGAHPGVRCLRSARNERVDRAGNSTWSARVLDRWSV
jgi:imidazolonepropionase-like amidohydrolase